MANVTKDMTVLKDLNAFINGISNPGTVNLLEITKNALSLLKTMPAARDAVLDYFCTLFDMAVKTYLTQVEKEIATGENIELSEAVVQDECVMEVHTALCNCVSSNPEAWAPIVSTWSLQLLGKLSMQYAGRAHIPVDAGLSEKMQLWIGCRATRTLIDITTLCLSCLMDSESEACISALLDSSVKHSPHFDWVVAHIGSCFPDTVITRVLSCGLKDYTHQLRSSPSKEDRMQHLSSVVGILGHLASGHFSDIRNALIDLFKKSILQTKQGSDSKISKKFVIPYLLQLASLSPTLRKALTTDIGQTVDITIIPLIADLTSDWARHFESKDAMMDLVVKLALGCEQGGTQLINLLLDCILSENISDKIRKNAWRILESIFLELDHQVRQNKDVNLLDSISKEMLVIEHMLLDANDIRLETACRLVILLGNKNPVHLVTPCGHILRRAKTDSNLAAVIKILSDPLNLNLTNIDESTYGSYLGLAIGHAISFTSFHSEGDDTGNRYENDLIGGDKCHIETESMEVDGQAGGPHSAVTKNKEHAPDFAPEQLWLNLIKLLRWEKEFEKKDCENSPKSENLFDKYENHRLKKIKNENLIIDNEDILSGLMVSKAIFDNLMEISLVFGNCAQYPQMSHIIAKLLVTLDIFGTNSLLRPPTLELILHLVKDTVKYFFICCEEEDVLLRAEYSSTACQLLNRFSVHSSVARALALRELLEHALFGPQAVLFGAKLKPFKTLAEENFLLYQNLKQGTSTMLQRDSSIFHAGIIGSGCRKTVINNLIEKDVLANNTQWLINAIKVCCMLDVTICDTNGDKVDDKVNAKHYKSPISLDSMTKVSLLLVEMISPDVMYNGLPWPEEEFSKVTIERDLHIRRLFNELPLLWDLMSMLAVYPPSLCYSSVLLRALTASLLHQWNSLGHQDPTGDDGSAEERINYKTLKQQTVKVLDIMALGQLLPKPLSQIRDIIPYLLPNEVVQLLRESVWNYMRDHIPSPALFKVDSVGWHYRDPDTVCPSAQYTDTLRLILQRNVETLGEFIGQMFNTSINQIDPGKFQKKDQSSTIIDLTATDCQ